MANPQNIDATKISALENSFLPFQLSLNDERCEKVFSIVEADSNFKVLENSLVMKKDTKLTEDQKHLEAAANEFHQIREELSKVKAFCGKLSSTFCQVQRIASFSCNRMKKIHLSYVRLENLRIREQFFYGYNNFNKNTLKKGLKSLDVTRKKLEGLISQEDEKKKCLDDLCAQIKVKKDEITTAKKKQEEIRLPLEEIDSYRDDTAAVLSTLKEAKKSLELQHCFVEEINSSIVEIENRLNSSALKMAKLTSEIEFVTLNASDCAYLSDLVNQNWSIQEIKADETFMRQCVDQTEFTAAENRYMEELQFNSEIEVALVAVEKECDTEDEKINGAKLENEMIDAKIRHQNEENGKSNQNVIKNEIDRETKCVDELNKNINEVMIAISAEEKDYERAENEHASVAADALMKIKAAIRKTQHIKNLRDNKEQQNELVEYISPKPEQKYPSSSENSDEGEASHQFVPVSSSSVFSSVHAAPVYLSELDEPIKELDQLLIADPKEKTAEYDVDDSVEMSFNSSFDKL